MDEKKKENICLRIDKEIVREIRMRAAFLNVSQNKWIIQAILEKIALENKIRDFK